MSTSLFASSLIVRFARFLAVLMFCLLLFELNVLLLMFVDI